MRIGGPKGSNPIRPPQEKTADKTAASGTSRFSGVLEADPGKDASAVRGAEASQTSRYAGQLEAVVGQLRAGEITRDQASEALVDAVVQARGTSLSSQQRQALTQALSSILKEDPHLTAQLSSLGSLATTGADG